MSLAHKPISRLSMELFHLGELPPNKHTEIEKHLISCAACRRSLEYIEHDTRPLPRLSIRPLSTRQSILDFSKIRLSYIFAACAAIIITGLAFLLVPTKQTIDQETAHAFTHIKGQNTSLYIVRNRNGVVTEEPKAFKQGDAFKVFVTHLDQEEENWILAVFQGDEVYFPITSQEPLITGARIPLPGAFSLDGQEPAEICVFIGNRIPNKQTFIQENKQLISQAADCKTLVPVDLDVD